MVRNRGYPDLPDSLILRNKINKMLFSGLIRNFEEKVQPLIVPAVLEHEEISGISGNKQSGFRTRSSSLREIDSPDGSREKPTEALLSQLTSHHKVFYNAIYFKVNLFSVFSCL